MTAFITKINKTFLKSTLSADATQIGLREFVDSKNREVDMDDIGEFGVVVIKTGNQIEMIKFDGLTRAINGSVTLDVATNGRNLDPTFPYTGYSTGLPFQAGAEVIVTNDPLTMSTFAKTDTPNTFTQNQKITVDPIAGNDIVRKSWVLQNLPAGAVSLNSIIVNGVAGEDVLAGQLVYLKDDGKWWKAISTDKATIEKVQLGVVESDTLENISIGSGVLVYGFTGNQTGGTAGAKAFATDVSGIIGTVTGTNEKVIGLYYSTTEIFFDPNFYYLLTPEEKAKIVALPEGELINTDQVYTEKYDQVQNVQDSSVEFGEDDSTTNKNIISQSFTAKRKKIRGFKLFKKPNTGTFTGTVSVSLRANLGGSASETNLATVTLTNAEYLAITDDTEFEAIFTTEYAEMIQENLYWIVVSSSTSDNANHPNLGINSSGGYTNGSAKFKNTTDDWVAIATIDLYFKTINGVEDQITKTPIVEIFNTSRVWKKPNTGTRVLVQMWGGGGSGGQGASNFGCGGGGGAYKEVYFDINDLNDTESVTVGLGGQARTTDVSGENGTNSIFNTATAYGGLGGQSANNPSASGGQGGGTLSGGAPLGGVTGGTTTEFSIYGGGGGQRSNNSGNGYSGGGSVHGGGGGGGVGNVGGLGGNSFYGGGGGAGGSYTTNVRLGGKSETAGNGGSGGSTNTIATDGSTPAGGGGGGKLTRSGAGGNGRVIITTF